MVYKHCRRGSNLFSDMEASAPAVEEAMALLPLVSSPPAQPWTAFFSRRRQYQGMLGYLVKVKRALARKRARGEEGRTK